MAYEKYRGFVLYPYGAAVTHSLNGHYCPGCCYSKVRSMYLSRDLTLEFDTLHDSPNSAWRPSKDDCREAIDAFWEKMKPQAVTEPEAELEKSDENT